MSALSPEAIIKQTSEQMIKALNDNRSKLDSNPDSIYELIDTIALPHFDIEAIVRSVLGKYCRQASTEQHRAFETEFQTLIMHTYAQALLRYTDEVVRVFPVPADTLKTNRVKVRSLIEGKHSQPVSILYRMRLKKGEWKIYDFSVEGVSLVLTYRQSFSEQIRNSGLDTLVRNLARKNAAFRLQGN